MVEAARNTVVQDNGSQSRRKWRGLPVAWKIVLWPVSLAYLLTSSVVIVNAFAWLPTLPSAWYVVQRVLYWPFQPYFELMARLLGSPSISYSTYVLVSWAPIMLVSLVLVLGLPGFGRKKKRL